jgi:hypothetical protein
VPFVVDASMTLAWFIAVEATAHLTPANVCRGARDLAV